MYFEYEIDTPVLKNVNFKISGDNKISGIAGESGGGKSTIINLIIKFYMSTAGDILINGEKIENILRNDIRSRISAVMQNDLLFDSDLEDNFKIVCKHATKIEIKESLDLVEISEVFEDTENPLTYKIEEGGKNLSGGQKMRILLCRALLRKPDVLIIDEGFSSIETGRESKIISNICAKYPEMMLIIISHRESTLSNCGIIYFIKDGGVVDSGKHTELLSKCAGYREMFRS